MKYQEIREQFIWNVRLDFDPVGIRFVYDDDEFGQLPVTHASKAKLTYCQYLTAVQQKKRCDLGEGASLLGEGSEAWPGLDVCKGCPMFKFEKLEP